MTRQLIALISNVQKTPQEMADALIGAVEKFRAAAADAQPTKPDKGDEVPKVVS